MERRLIGRFSRWALVAFLAERQQAPRDRYDAAAENRANYRQACRCATLPLLPRWMCPGG
jgi:hypothetical protein